MTRFKWHWVNFPATCLYLRDTSATMLRQKLLIKLPIAPSHILLTPGQPVLELSPQCQAPGRAATEITIFKSLARLSLEKSQRGMQGSRLSLPLMWWQSYHYATHHLVGLVVKGSASRGEYQGFESHLRRIESYQ